MNTTEGKNMTEYLEERYSNLSKMDLAEEVFAAIFSRRLIGSVQPDFDNLFNSLKESKSYKDLNNIFSEIIKLDNMSIDKLVYLFEKGVKETNDFSFSNTKTYRKKSNWLSKQIKEGSIREEC